jgi:hypothetical protein
MYDKIKIYLSIILLSIVNFQNGWSQDIATISAMKECGLTKGSITISMDESQFDNTWVYPMDVQLQNTDTYEYIEAVIEDENDKTFGQLPAGTYKVTIDLSAYCSIDLETAIEKDLFVDLMINPGDPPIANAPSCSGDNNGGLVVSAKHILSGAILKKDDLLYKWENNSTHYFRYNLSQGIYCITATDKAGYCKAEKCFNVENVNYDVDIVKSKDPTNCANPDGFIAVKGSNPAYTYNYAWDNGSTNDTLSNLAGGQYCVTVKHRTCQVIKCVKLKPLCCSNSLVVSGIVTNGHEGGPYPPTGSIDISMSGGSGTYSYTWSIFEQIKNGYTILPNLSGHIQSQLGSGTYRVVIEDINTGCKTHFVKGIFNVKCKNNLDIFKLYRSDNTVPLSIASDPNEDCSLNKGRSIYVYSSSLGTSKVTLPLKIELLPPPGVPNVLDSVRFINTQAQLNAMQGWNLASLRFIPAYRVQSPYKVRFTDGCGFTKTLEMTMCLECQNPIYDSSGKNKNYVFLQHNNIGGHFEDIHLEIKNPCKKGGNYIKLVGKPYNGFRFTIIWPNGDSCFIERLKNGGIWKTYPESKFKYNVSKAQFEAKLPLIVTVKRRDADCVETISVVFNGGENNLIFAKTNANGYPQLKDSYRGIATCKICSSLPAVPSTYAEENDCPVEPKDLILWDYIPNDPENVCTEGGKFVSDIIENGNIVNRVVLVPAGIPVLDEVNHYVSQPEDLSFGKCIKGKTCVFDGKYFFGPTVNKKIMLRYCNLYATVDPFDQPSLSCESCPTSLKITTVDKNLKLLIYCNGYGYGQLTITSPNGQVQVLDDIGYWPSSTEFIFNTGGLLGKFKFEFDPQCPSGCNTITAYGDNAKAGCPIGFEIVSFTYAYPQTGSILINSPTQQSTRLIIHEEGSTTNIEDIGFIAIPGENLINFSCSNLQVGKKYVAEITFLNSLCDAIPKLFTYVSKPENCPSIEVNPYLSQIDLSISSENSYSGKFFLLVYDVLQNIVKKVTINISAGQNISSSIDVSKLPKGNYTIKIVNTLGCPPIQKSWTKTFIVDPNPDGDCILNRSVDLYFNSKTDEYIHTTSESFISSNQYTVTSISDSSYTTILEYVRLSYDSLIVTHVRIDDYGNYIVVGKNLHGTSILLISPSKLVIWQKYFPDFIVTSVPYYILASKYPLDIIGKLSYTDIYYSLKIDYNGTIVSYQPLRYYDTRTGVNGAANGAFLHKDNFTSSYFKNGTTRVSIYQSGTNFTRSITLDSFITVKQILRLESGEYMIAGNVYGTTSIDDSLTYDFDYSSGIFIWTDTLLNVIKTKVFNINEAIDIKNVVSNGVDKYIIVYITNDTIFNEINDSIEMTTCDQFYGFENPTLHNRNMAQEDTVHQIQTIYSNNSTLHIYPNPSNGDFTIDVKSDETTHGFYSILTIDGKLLNKEKVNIHKGENEFPLTNFSLKSGIYLLEMKLVNGVDFHSKLMIVE